MTFCVAINVRDGLIALADTQIVSGDQRSSKGKLSMHAHRGRTFCLMTSGLRSVRDKAVVYLEEHLREEGVEYNHIHEIATAFGKCLRRVRSEDGAALAESGFRFNCHCLIGGKLCNDASPGLIQVYPEGNWIMSHLDAPFFIIGRSSHGRPILDRMLTYETPVDQAITLAYLAFNATSASVTDVDYPIDLAVLDRDKSEFAKKRCTERDLLDVNAAWVENLRLALSNVPVAWQAGLVGAQEPS